MRSTKKKRKRKIIWYRLLLLVILIMIPIYLFTPLRSATEYLFLPETTRSLLKLEYTLEEINYLKEHLSEEDIVTIIDKEEHHADLVKYAGAPNFCLNRLDRYREFLDHEENHHRSVILVNVHADLEHYTNIQTVDNPNDTAVLVNKFYRLTEDFTPELINMRPALVQRSGLQLRADANDAFIRLTDAARVYNYRIIAFSAFRSYERQTQIYNNFVRTRGQREADLVSARPGHSEHQTGLALDVTRFGGGYENFEDTDEYTWLSENAHRFGFIIRYPDDKKYITGYVYEPWHIRYVGVEAANIIFTENITLEEYFVIHTEIPC